MEHMQYFEKEMEVAKDGIKKSIRTASRQFRSYAPLSKIPGYATEYHYRYRQF